MSVCFSVCLCVCLLVSDCVGCVCGSLVFDSMAFEQNSATFVRWKGEVEGTENEKVVGWRADGGGA